MFKDFFEVIEADTPELRDIVYRLRYQVYCVETKFEDTADHPGGLERDPYDTQSVHALLRHKRSGLYAGTVRLVLPKSGELVSLPLHEVCDEEFFRDRNRFRPEDVVEVSRFAISKDFRRRLDEFGSPSAAGNFDPERERRYHEQEQKVMPHIVLGLFVGMVQMSRERDIKTWFCVMERALVRLLARYSLHFEAVGPTVEYHGKRQPCVAHIDEFLNRAYEEQPEIWKLITDNGRLWSSS